MIAMKPRKMAHRRRIMLTTVLAVIALLASAPAILHADTLPRVLTTIEAPTNYEIDGKFSGTTTEIARALLGQLGWGVEIEVLPWARAYKEALRTPNCILFTAGKTQERLDAGFTFIGPVATRKHAVFTRSDTTPMSAEQVRLSGTRIAAMRSDWRALRLSSEGYVINSLTQHKQGFLMLMQERLDYWVSSDLEAPIVARENGFDPQRYALAWVIEESSSYFAFSPGSAPEIIAAWARSLEHLSQTDFFQKQLRYWRNELGIRLNYSAELGYYVDSFP